jgi:molecular chaperone HscB
MDAFDRLGLPAKFDLTADEVERAHLGRMMLAHPDLAGEADPFGPPIGAGLEEDETTESAALNEAKETLLNPERRADVLVLRLGGPSRLGEKGLPPGFLVEFMESREAIDAVLQGADEAGKTRWRLWAAAERSKFVDRVSGLFRRGGSGEASLREIRVQLNAWRYIERAIEQLG